MPLILCGTLTPAGVGTTGAGHAGHRYGGLDVAVLGDQPCLAVCPAGPSRSTAINPHGPPGRIPTLACDQRAHQPSTTPRSVVVP